MAKTIKVPDDLYDRIKKLADEQGKAMHEVIRDALDKMEIGDVQIKLPKPKFIRLQYPAWCVLGNHKIDPEEYKRKKGRYPYALWFPELGGVICLDCLIKEVFTKEQQAKTLAKLEVEIRRLRGIKNELNKEVQELAEKVSIMNVVSELSDIIDELRGIARDIDSAVQEYLWRKNEEESEKAEVLRELTRALKEVASKLEQLELPKKWVERFIKTQEEERPKKKSYAYRSGYYGYRREW